MECGGPEAGYSVGAWTGDGYMIELIPISTNSGQHYNNYQEGWQYGSFYSGSRKMKVNGKDTTGFMKDNISWTPVEANVPWPYIYL